MKLTTNEKKRTKTEGKNTQTEDRRQEKGKEEEINMIQLVIETEPRKSPAAVQMCQQRAMLGGRHAR
jgi:hypothetical protein